MILSVAVVIFAYFSLSVHGAKIHEHMTDEEIESVFKVKPDSMHEVDYDFIKINYRENKLHTNRLDAYMKTSSHEYLLYLEDNKVFLGRDTPIYVEHPFADLKIPPIYHIKAFYSDYFPDENSLKLYHDYKNQAAFAVHTDEHNNRHFDGVIGDSVHISSIPDRLHKELKRNYSALLETSPDTTNLPRDMNNSTYHVIINKSNNTMNDARNNHSNDDNLLGQEFKIPPRTYETKEHTVYPEILIAPDYETFKLHGCDIKKIAKYMAAFWNAVDLRFRELTDPRVNLNIAGLIIPKFQNSSGYSYKDGRNMLDNVILYNIFSNPSLPTDSYDVIVAITAYELQKDSLGLAHPNGACLDHSAVVQDLGSFTGILVAAHELGHLFGSPHDPQEAEDDCDWKNKFIMKSSIRSTSVRWSHCSKEAMKKFFRSDYANCLKNKPNVGSQYPKILPGTLLSRNEQCLRRTQNDASNDTQYIADCETLWCQEKDKLIDGKISRSLPESDYFQPAEGTSCGINRICLDGYCVEDSPSFHSTNSIWDI